MAGQPLIAHPEHLFLTLGGSVHRRQRLVGPLFQDYQAAEAVFGDAAGSKVQYQREDLHQHTRRQIEPDDIRAVELSVVQLFRQGKQEHQTGRGEVYFAALVILHGVELIAASVAEAGFNGHVAEDDTLHVLHQGNRLQDRSRGLIAVSLCGDGTGVQRFGKLRGLSREDSAVAFELRVGDAVERQARILFPKHFQHGIH